MRRNEIYHFRPDDESQSGDGSLGSAARPAPGSASESRTHPAPDVDGAKDPPAPERVSVQAPAAPRVDGASRPQQVLEFTTNNRAGFRLDRLEVFNWGTFDRRVWSLEPHGGTALLTGANGSGKSTLVDALLTLLVPNVKRGYNVASGADTKKERDERSYVRGAYGKFRGEESLTSQTRYLRDTKNDFSVILASFYNEGFGQRVVLANMFYFLNGDLRKFFVVSPHDLTISEAFAGFDDVRSLRRKLRDSGAEVFDQFKDYSKHFRRAFGLRSEKALDLFNQTISIKAIGDLNSFVRTHMLEQGDPGSYIARLRTHFEDLTRTYDAIQRAREQIEKLQPIDRDGKSYTALSGQIDALDAQSQALPGVFASWACDLLQTAITSTQSDLDAERGRLREAETSLSRLRERERELAIAISHDEVGRRVQLMEDEIRRTEEERDRLRRQWDQYRTAADALELPMPQSEQAFTRQRSAVEGSRSATEKQLEDLMPQRDEAAANLRRLTQQIDEHEEELESLRKRQNQIPVRQLKLRQQILDDLDLSPDELPFIGELLQVRPEERAWEGAIERLLHSFALRVIVPPQHYERVNDYVDRTHLDGRLVYSRIPDDPPAHGVRDHDPARLYNKLEVKRDTRYHGWLQAELTKFYDHCCCDVEQFRNEPRALTRSGLIKQNKVVHEKDDRSALADRRRYVLGWDNREKIRAIREELDRLERERSTFSRLIEDNDRARRSLTDRIRRLDDLLRYGSFSEIDKDGAVRRIEALREEKRRLEASSDTLQELRSEQAGVREQIGDAEERRRAFEKQITLLENRCEQYEKRLAQSRTTLEVYDPADLSPFEEELRGRLEEPVALDTIDSLREKVGALLSAELRKLEHKKSDVHGSIVRAMERYKGDYPQETIELDAHIDALPEYQQRLAVLRKEDLPRHEEQFRVLLKSKLMEDVSFFERALQRQKEEIEEKVLALNRSLDEIDYSPSTYIQLETSASRDVEIVEFKHQLKGLFAGNPDNDAESEAIFHRIRDLILRFEEDERWTARVTDVRNWVNFGIRERYRESGEEKSWITDSDGLSGGQKAKLAYTILGAAIAYQFGLDHGETRSKSFRFVVIDEAFSKIDEDNARYAMELFKKLALQLLVVSPLGATRVVEDYITTCHFIANNEEGSCSQIRNLTIEEYNLEKARTLADRENGHAA